MQIIIKNIDTIKMKSHFSNRDGAKIIDKLIITIRENKQYLSDIDGLIGDGDHGINMSKGFTLCREELDKNPGDLAHCAMVLSRILMMKIGGSMGPLYGKMFKGFSAALQSVEQVDTGSFGKALDAMLTAVQSISPAKPGDKTLVDALQPAVEAFLELSGKGFDLPEALHAMKAAAVEGRDSTIQMVAKLGRASRLGERSRGVPDAGAVSCCLILGTMADAIIELIS
jgi:phosphoenolpyruvate---glycerone phosphotransferase subunit DhaL